MSFGPKMIGTFLRREKHLFFNIYYFVMRYTSADWYVLYMEPGLDELVLIFFLFFLH